MGLRGRTILEPWPVLPVSTSFEVKTSSLDSDVQELLGTCNLGAYGLTNDVQFAVIYIKISADLACQLEIVSEVPGGFIRPASYGRLPHAPSSLRTAAWGEKRSGVPVMSTRAVSSKRDVPAR